MGTIYIWALCFKQTINQLINQAFLRVMFTPCSYLLLAHGLFKLIITFSIITLFQKMYSSDNSNLNEDNRFMFQIYHEDACNKGPNEVILLINGAIINEITKTLYLFSDNCGGQNKNYTLIRYCNALIELQNFSNVFQYYLLKGHSFLLCDSSFGLIEQAKNKIACIYIVKEVVDRCAYRRGK